MYKAGENAMVTLRAIPKALFLLLVFAPLCALILQLPGVSGWGAFLPDGRRLNLLLQSLGLALGVAAGATSLGLLAALALWRRRNGRFSRWKWLPLIMVTVPPYVHALAWATMLRLLTTGGAAGGPLALRGWLLAGWVETMAFLPIAVGLSLLGLETVEPDLIECGRVIRSDLGTLARIILPLAAPGILAGFASVFLLSLTDYSVPSIFGVDVYALEVFAGYSASASPTEPALLAVPLVVVAALAVLGALKPLRQAACAASPRSLTEMAPLSFPGWFKLVERGGFAILGLQILTPLVVLGALMERPAASAQTLHLAAGDASYSFWIAGVAALLCLVPALGAARALAGEGRPARRWWLATVFPLAIPAPLVGIGLIVLWNRPSFAWLYDSAWMPVLAALARFLPWAALLALAQLKRLDQQLVDAARVHARSPLRCWLRTDLPLVAPGLLAAGALVFALTLGELGATLLVTPPGRSTLTIRIYNYLHYGGSAEVATLCLVMLLIGLAAGLTAWAALGGWAWMSRRNAS
jgi:iron(III) transport system permease protein